MPGILERRQLHVGRVEQLPLHCAAVLVERRGAIAQERPRFQDRPLLRRNLRLRSRGEGIRRTCRRLRRVVCFRGGVSYCFECFWGQGTDLAALKTSRPRARRSLHAPRLPPHHLAPRRRAHIQRRDTLHRRCLADRCRARGAQRAGDARGPLVGRCLLLRASRPARMVSVVVVAVHFSRVPTRGNATRAWLVPACCALD